MVETGTPRMADDKKRPDTRPCRSSVEKAPLRTRPSSAVPVAYAVYGKDVVRELLLRLLRPVATR